MNRTGEFEIDLYDIYKILKKRWKILLVSFLMGATAMAAYSGFTYQRVFHATAMLYVMPKDDKDMVTAGGVQTGAFLAPDFMLIITQPQVSAKVVEKLKLPMSGSQAAKKITVSNPPDTRLLAVTATDQDFLLSRELANAFAEEAASYFNGLMMSNGVTILHEAQTPEPSEPPAILTMALIGGIGLLVMVGLVMVVREMTDGKIHTEADVEKYLGQKVSVSVSKLQDMTASCDSIKDRILLLGKEIHTVLFTCAEESEGAMEMLIQTASRLTASDKKVLVLDSNLRGNDLEKRYPEYFSQKNSLAEYLSSDETILPIITGVEEKWDAVFSGGRSSRILELLMMDKFTELLDKAITDQHYDYILIYTAPLCSGVEGSYIAEKCDKTILVIERKKTVGVVARDAYAKLQSCGNKVMGVVLNG